MDSRLHEGINEEMGADAKEAEATGKQGTDAKKAEATGKQGAETKEPEATKAHTGAEKQSEPGCEDKSAAAGPGSGKEETQTDAAENAETSDDKVPDPAGDEKDAEASDGAAPSSDGKWHVFGRKKEKKDSKDPKDQKIEELTDQLRRQMAEFDNYRKRTEKEKSAMFEVGAKSIIEKILPVIDNFERGLASVPEDVKGTSFAEGMEKIYKQLLKNLEDAGVKPIEAKGQPFDPNFHNAVMHVEDENLGENIVAQELQKGYMYRDNVVRHSMVQVAN